METPKPSSRARRATISFLIGIGVFLLSALIENILHAFNIRGIWEWVDNFVAALATGLIVLAYEQRQYRKNLARLRVIAEVNHHIRNALQPVVYLATGTMPEQQMRMIRDSVDRIQWALAEVLPSDLVASSTERPKPKAPRKSA